MPLSGIRYLSGGRSAEAAFRSGPGRGVRRTTLQAALADAVAAAGVEVVPEPVERVVQSEREIAVNGRSAAHLVAADGLHSPVRRMLGLDAPPRPAGRRFGQRLHASLEPWSDLVEVHWSADAEAYVTPVAPDLVGVALLTSSRAPFAELLCGFPELAERLSAVDTSRVLGAGPLRQRSRQRVLGRVLLVGDASGYVDAITGEGVALGLAQAEAAVDAIASGRVASYEGAWRRVSRRYLVMTHAVRAAAAWPPSRRMIVPLAVRRPGVFAAAVNELAR
jgi:flavin-dependent dehydrogenase